jgi:DNA-binding NarL/FixJ family response regulator
MNVRHQGVSTENHPLKLLLIDRDSIFRLGLQVALGEFPQIEVVSAVESDTLALQVLTESCQTNPNQINLVVMELGNGRSRSSQHLGLLLCKQLKAQYPNLPLFLLSAVQDSGWLLAAKNVGVDGYCPKGTAIAELVTAMERVTAGDRYWLEEGGIVAESAVVTTPELRPFARLQRNLRLSAMGYINSTLGQVTAKLQTPGHPLLETAILAGRRRELLAARQLIQLLLTSSQERQQQTPLLDDEQWSINSPISGEIVPLEPPRTTSTPSLLSPRAIQSELFSAVVSKLQFSLQNVTDVPLEIDILREDKKRELLYIILQKLADVLDDLRDSHLQVNQLSEVCQVALMDLWQASTQEFFGKFTRVSIDNQDVEIVNVILQDGEIIKTAIINKIPLVVDLFAYLIFQQELTIDNISYPAYSSEAKERGSMLTENILIQVGNSVIQPLLNRLADVNEIKQNYYNQQLASTREIERIRNNLSWKYRLRNYIQEPQQIFESRYQIFVFAPRGIAKTSIYAHRSHELTQLTGIPLAVTLLLEFRDAIAPRLQSLVSFLGSGVVFILTQVVGRAIGLIGRGILQGIGNASFPDKTWRRKSERDE